MISLQLSDDVIELSQQQNTQVVTLRVVNQSNILEYFSVSVDLVKDLDTPGLEPGWITCNPTHFDLRPLPPNIAPAEDEHQKTIQVAITLPPGVLAGTYAGRIVIAARSGSENSGALPISIVMSEEEKQLLTIDPPEIVSRKKRSIYKVSLINQGNAPHLYSLYADDPENACQFELIPSEVPLHPGQQADMTLRVRPKPRNWLDPDKKHIFTVRLEGFAQTANAAFTQRAALPFLMWLGRRWKRFALLLVALFALFIVAAIFLFPLFAPLRGATCTPYSQRTIKVESNDIRTQLSLSGPGGTGISQVVVSESATELPGLFASLVSVSPDGRKLAYITARNQALDDAKIWIYDLETRQPKVAVANVPTTGLWPSAPIWSADGEQIAFVRRNRNLAAQTASTAAPTTVSSAITGTATVSATATTAPPAPATSGTPGATVDPNQLEVWVAKMNEPARLLGTHRNLKADLFYGMGEDGKAPKPLCWNQESSSILIQPKAFTAGNAIAMKLADGTTSEVRKPTLNDLVPTNIVPTGVPSIQVSTPSLPRIGSGYNGLMISGLSPPQPAQIANPATSNNCAVRDPYSQNDPRWGDISLKNGLQNTIGDSGCAVTAAAMLMNVYGANSVNGKTLDPKTLLLECLDDNTIAPLEEKGWQLIGQRCGNLQDGSRAPFSWDDLNKALERGPAIVGLLGGQTGFHFLIVNGLVPNGLPNTASSYSVVDPWDGTTYKTIGDFFTRGYRLGWLISYQGRDNPCLTAAERDSRLRNGLSIKVSGVEDGGLYRDPKIFQYSVDNLVAGGTATGVVRISGKDGSLSNPSQSAVRVSQPYPFDTDGIYSVALQAYNPGNTITTTRNLIFSIDRTPPVVTHTLSINADPKTKKFTAPVTVQFRANDALSGISLVEYQRNNGQWEQYTSDTIPDQLLFKDNGVFRVNYRATDGAGNIALGSVTLDIEIEANKPAGARNTPTATTVPANGGALTPVPGQPGAANPNAPSAVAQVSVQPTTVAPRPTTARPTTAPPTTAPPTTAPPTTAAPTTAAPTTAAPTTAATTPSVAPTTAAATTTAATTPSTAPATTAPPTTTVAATATSTPSAVLAINNTQLVFGPTDTTVSLQLANNGNAPLSFNIPQPSGNVQLSFNPSSGTIAPVGGTTVEVTLNNPNLTGADLTTSFQVNSNGGNKTVNVTVKPLPLPTGTITFEPALVGGVLPISTTVKINVTTPTGAKAADHAVLVATYKPCLEVGQQCNAAAQTLTVRPGSPTFSIVWNTQAILPQTSISLAGKLCTSVDESVCTDLPAITNLSTSLAVTLTSPSNGVTLPIGTLVSLSTPSARVNNLVLSALQDNFTFPITPTLSTANNWQLTWDTSKLKPGSPITLKGRSCANPEQTVCQDLTLASGMNTAMRGAVGFSQDLLTNKTLPNSLTVTITPTTNLTNTVNINHATMYATYRAAGESIASEKALTGFSLRPNTNPPWQVVWNTANIPAQNGIILKVKACFYPDESLCTNLIPQIDALVIQAGPPAAVQPVQGSSQSAVTGTAFAQDLVAVVKDANGNPVIGVRVSLALPASGASGTFSLGGSSLGISTTVTTDATGQTTSLKVTANQTGGTYQVQVSLPDYPNVPATTFLLTNVPPGSVPIQPLANTTPQSQKITKTFPVNLGVRVLDSFNNPVVGLAVTFFAPTTGQGGLFAGGTISVTVNTLADGTATAPPFTANTTRGQYLVTATAPGSFIPADFTLTNLPGDPASMVALPGTTPQNVNVNASLTTPLAVEVRDVGNGLLDGVPVTFAAPTSGASGIFAGATTSVVTSTVNGVATAPTYTANATAGGPYNVVASLSPPFTPTVNFAITNVEVKLSDLLPLNPPGGAVGNPFSKGVTASGGTAPYTYSVSAGTLPNGLNLNTATGAITGTPTAAGTFNFDLSAVDSLGFIASRSYSLTIFQIVLGDITPAPPAGAVGNAFSKAVTASGGTAAYTYSITVGALPPGLALNTANGAITGNPTALGSYDFTITATDANGYTGTRSYTVVIVSITLAPVTLPSGAVGVAYSQTIVASGGTAPYTYAVSAGTLPTGLALNATTGDLTGTPTAAGTYNFTVRATDANSFTGSRAYSLVIALNLSPALLPNGIVGTPYNQTVTASGGTAPYTYAVSAGTLPTGLTLNTATGQISGTPTANGAFNFTITATDLPGNTGSRAYNVIVQPPININPATLPNGIVGTAYNQTISATGGAGAPYTFAVTAGTLPTGLALDGATGQISGTPTANGTFNFTVTVTDSGGFTASRAYTVIIFPAIVVTPAPPLPVGAQGTPYTQAFGATGGTGTYVNFVVTAGALPAGLTLNGTTGVLSGTPTANGTFNFTLTVTDSGGFTGSRAYTLIINAPIVVTPATLPPGMITAAYNQTIGATGGSGTYTNFAVTAGTLPGGLTLNATTGALTGTPTATGTFNFTVTVTDSLGFTGSRAYTLTINSTITVTPPTLPAGAVSSTYNRTIGATGGTGTYTNFAVTAGTLPGGLTLNATTGALTGTPTAAGTFNFTITVTDSAGYTGSLAYTLVINNAIAISPATLPNGAVGSAYNRTISATGGSGGITFAVTAGALPGGLTLTAGGVLSGTPTANGTFNFTVTATDSAGNTANQAYTLLINAGIVVNPATLPAGAVSSVYNQTISATGGSGGFTFAVTAGTLPAGLTLSAAGVLSGTPTATGTSNFTITATDSSSNTGTRAYALTINAAIVISPASPLPAGAVNSAYNPTISATGGSGGFTFAVTAGTLPNGLTLSGAGVLSGTPTGIGTSNFTVTATDSAGNTATQAYSLTINAAIAISPATLPPGVTGTAYNQTISATGGSGGFSFAVTTGTLPAGLTLTAGGVLSGTPTAAGTSNFTVTATDSAGNTATQAYSLTINGPIVINPTTLPNGAVGSAYSRTISATGGAGGYTFAVTAGTLPAGLTLTAGGLLSGTPTTAGTSNFTITATDSASFTGSRAYTLIVNNAIAISPASPLPDGATGSTYNRTISATGGSGGFTFAVTVGTLPAGLTLSGAGILSGTPTGTGTSNFSVTATDSAGNTTTQNYALTINAAIVISPASPLPIGAVGSAYNQTIGATGGSGGITFAVTVGTLPAGLTLTGAGLLSGTPTATGTSNFTVTATDSAGNSRSQAYTLVINAAIAINPATLPAGAVNSAYNRTISATGGSGGFTFAVTTGTLPPGFTLTAGGVLSGTPSATGTSNFTVTATDSTGNTAAQAYNFVINAAIVISPVSPLPSGAVSSAYNRTISATGGSGGITFAVTTGTLPAGLTLSGAGVLSGTPTTAGTSNFTVTATDSAGNTAAQAYSLTINNAIAISPASPLTPGTTGTPYTQNITATGGSGGYTFAVTTGTLPGGLTLTAGGVLSGTPTAAGTFNFTITATDSAGNTASRAYSLTIV